MANNYSVELRVSGRKSDLDEIEKIFTDNKNVDRNWSAWYMVGLAIEAMGFDPETVENRRAYTENVERVFDDALRIDLVGAWRCPYGVLRCIKKRWPDVTINWSGVDEFGQDPLTNIPELVGRYRLEDEDEGLNPFCDLDEWASDEEAVPVINAYYHTNVKTIQEGFDTIDKLGGSMRMELYPDSKLYAEEEINDYGTSY